MRIDKLCRHEAAASVGCPTANDEGDNFFQNKLHSTAFGGIDPAS
jgi:hypothetical protein